MELIEAKAGQIQRTVFANSFYHLDFWGIGRRVVGHAAIDSYLRGVRADS